MRMPKIIGVITQEANPHVTSNWSIDDYWKCKKKEIWNKKKKINKNTNEVIFSACSTFMCKLFLYSFKKVAHNI